MRASRLLTILLTLQTQGQVTAQELADRLEVSVRTVYRDVESLSAAGIPVYAERGPAGGYRLLDGFRTRINGLTNDEADSLFLAGLPGQAQELGLGATVASAQLKVMAGMPEELRERAGRVRERFHLDAVGWYRDADETPHLAEVASGVWTQHRIWMRYHRWGGEVERELEPYGLVLKGGAWYLVARATYETEVQFRTYRVNRIREIKSLEVPFERDPDFDLTKFWTQSSERFGNEMYRIEATVRLSEHGRGVIRNSFSSAAGRMLDRTAGEPDDEGWLTAKLPVESLWTGTGDFLQLGPHVEVLGPPELREAVAEAARATAALYT